MVHLICYAKKTEDAEGAAEGKRSDMSPELWAHGFYMSIWEMTFIIFPNLKQKNDGKGKSCGWD